MSAIFGGNTCTDMTLMLLTLLILGALNLANAQHTEYQQDQLELYPQPREIRVTPRLSAASERSRLRQTYMWSDVQGTGFFHNPKMDLSVNVSGLDNGHKVRIAFGPPALVDAQDESKDYTTDELFYLYSGNLRNGHNRLVNMPGGIIYVQYTYERPSVRPPDITVELGQGAQPFPWYQQNKTDPDLFRKAVRYTNIPYAELDGHRVIVTGLSSSARSFMDFSNIDALLDTYATIINAQDRISGLDGRPGNEPSPLRPAIVQTNSNVEGNAADNRAAMGTSDPQHMWSTRVLQRSWKTWHELGHQRQHTDTWSWEAVDEVTVNIYALAAMRQLKVHPDDEMLKKGPDGQIVNTIPLEPIGHGTHEEWKAAEAYLKTQDAQKDFEKASDATRLVMFEQLRLAFGDEFYHAMHRASRKKRYQKVPDEAKRDLFMLEAAKASGTDLSAFFDKWGMRPTPRVRAIMRRRNRPKRDYTLLETYKAPTRDGSEE